MLLPGIYVWETGGEGGSSPTSVEAVRATSPNWENSMTSCGEWNKGATVAGLGRFVQSTTPTETVTVVVNECTSTMEVARYLVEKGLLGEWGAVLAVRQSDGRGQLRRHWVSPAGNLHVSVVLPKKNVDSLWKDSVNDLLPLVCGYVFAESFEFAGATVALKWPNDFLQDDRKVGGMLIEEKNGTVILGMGVNLVASPPNEKMREDHSVPAAVLQMDTACTGPLELWRTLVNRGKNVYTNVFTELEPAEFLAAMTNRLVWLGHRVRILERERDVYYADIVGISPLGGLVIRRDGRESVLFSGSIAPL